MKTILHLLMIAITISNVSGGKIVYNIPFIKSYSMLPYINPDINIVKGIKYDSSIKLNTNDVICFNPDYRYFYGGGYRYVCHRIIDIKNNTYLTKGDNNPVEDYYVKEKDIQFKIVGVE